MEELKKENEKQNNAQNEVQKEEKSETKKKKKGKHTGVKVTACALTAVALVGAGVYVGTNMIPKDFVTNKENNTSVKVSNNVQEVKLVTDAFNNSKIYNEGINRIEYSFRIPKINIDSSYVSDINKELNDKLISSAKKIIESNEPGALLEVDYKYYENGDILSVVVWEKYEGGVSNYYVYNINKKTGQKVTSEELLKTKNLDKVLFENKLSNALGIEFKNSFGEYYNWIQTQSGSAEDTKNFYNKQYNLTIYSDNCKLENQKIYLGDNGKIFVVGKIYNLAGGEYSYHIIDLENIKLEEKNKQQSINTNTESTQNTNSINSNTTSTNNNITNSNTINTSSNSSNENVISSNDPSSVAINEIKKCLKDKEWLKNNVYMKKSCFDTNIEGEQTLSFMKVKSADSNVPMVAIKATSEKDLSREVFLVSYKDGNVSAKSITGFALHIGHSNVLIDPNNQMADYTYFHMGMVKDSYVNIKNSNIEFLDSVGYYFELDENGTEKKSNFTKHYGEEKNETSITEAEYNNLKSKYNSYKFYDITTELTDSNIDKYLK